MPKVTTSTARKDYPESGIKKGDTYYSWAFFRGPTLRSKNYPKPSQLTANDKKSAALAASEALEEAVAAATTPEDVKSALEECVSSLEEVISEYEDTISNIEDAFPNGCPNLDDANEAKDNVESFKSDLEDAIGEVDDLDASDYEVKPEAKDKADPGWDDLTEDGQDEMLEAARELAGAGSLDL